jgi:hypothetical protein
MSESSIVINEVLPRVYHLKFDSKPEMAATFLRFQEYYESPNPAFRGHSFTLDQYKAWYIEQMGCFSYYTDWGGFNIPGDVLKPFVEGQFDPLSDQELGLLDAVSGISRQQPFYLIGANDPRSMAHEMAHALWYVNRAYHKKMSALLNRIPSDFKDQFLGTLRDTGYCLDVVEDELQAYLLGDDTFFQYQGMDITPYSATITAMRKVFQAYL